MFLIIVIIILGSFLGYYLAKKKNGKFLDKIQYASVFGIIFLLIAIVLQIIIIRLDIF